MAAPTVDLLSADTVLRVLRADETPYPGSLHAGGDTGDDAAARTVWVDADVIPPAVWRADPQGHLLVPLDLARTPDGHAAVLPYCAVRLDDVVGAGPRPGEVVTIAVSLLRGAVDARRAGVDCGTWWVDATGRPVLAAAGSSPWPDATRELASVLAASATSPLRNALEDLGRLLALAHPTPDEIVACEDALFRAAEPMPLSVGATRHESPQMLSPRRALALAHETEPSPAETWLGRFTDTAWASRVGDALRSLIAAGRGVAASAAARRQVRADGRRSAVTAEAALAPPGASPTRGGRRAPWLVAAVVGGVVVIGGVMWPTGESTRAAPASGSSAAGDASPAAEGSGPAAAPMSTGAASAAPAAPTAAPSPTDSDQGAPAADPDAVVRVALAGLAACAAGGGATCPEVMEDPSASAPTGVVSSSDTPTATLVD
ncbi:MAG TPA: hypothetical protein VEP72_06925, partial [Microbacterium sp.]|nr:hypothetical protein [Microbacterium sp.]